MKDTFGRRFCLGAVAAGVSFTASAVGTLPADCVVLDYIETVATGSGGQGLGDQYILLDYTPTAGSVVEAEVAILDKTFNQSIFCARGSGNDKNTFSLFWISATTDPKRGFRWDYNCNTEHGGWGSVTEGYSAVLTCKSAGLWIDDVKTIDTSSKDTPTSTGQMMLFAAYSDGKTDTRGNYAKIRLYSFKAYDSDGTTPAVDLVPCSNKTSHAVFLYDVANDKPYYNKGSTPFVGGLPVLFTVDPIADQQLVVPMVRPKPIVRDRKSGDVLVEGTHYTLSYSGAVNTFGTVVVSVTGIGDYADYYVRTVSYQNLRVPTLKISEFTFTMDITPAADAVSEPLANFPVLGAFRRRVRRGLIRRSAERTEVSCASRSRTARSFRMTSTTGRRRATAACG